jgi:hypothetical protein
MKNTEEHQLQVSIHQWIIRNRERVPALFAFFAVPNGELRAKSVGARLKLEGVKAGVPDLCIACPSKDGRKHGLFVELKTSKGKVSPEQKEWILRLNLAGYRADVVRSLDEFVEVVGEMYED